VPLGQSGLLVSPIGLGTWAWGNRLLWGYDPQRDDARLRAAFERAAALGVNLWDTGDSYGTSLPGGSSGGGGGGSEIAPGVQDGRAEALLGEFDRGVQARAAAAAGRRAGSANSKNGLLGGIFAGLLPQQAPSSSGPAKAIIATKLAAYPWRLTPEATVIAARASRRRVAGLSPGNDPSIDDASLPPLGVAQAHWSTANYQPLQEKAQLEGLARVCEQGIARAVGLSNYGPRELERAADFFEARIGTPPAVVQIQWSLLSDGPEQRDTAALCRERGIALIGYSPLALGALSGRYDASGGGGGGAGSGGSARRPLPPGLRGFVLGGIIQKAQPLLACVRAIADERGKTPAQVAIAWVRAQGAVPIPGAKSAAQVEEAVGSVSGWQGLSAAELEELAAASRACRAGKLMPRNVFQTR
jgi:pyridoxine 4-dehydrogenase